jgi:hypothetical protein
MEKDKILRRAAVNLGDGGGVVPNIIPNRRAAGVGLTDEIASQVIVINHGAGWGHLTRALALGVVEIGGQGIGPLLDLSESPDIVIRIASALVIGNKIPRRIVGERIGIDAGELVRAGVIGIVGRLGAAILGQTVAVGVIGVARRSSAFGILSQAIERIVLIVPLSQYN